MHFRRRKTIVYRPHSLHLGITMKRKIETILSIGIKGERTTALNKKLRLLNQFCLIWSVAVPIWIIQESIVNNDNVYLNILMHLLTFASILVMFALNKRRKLEVSKGLFFITLIETMTFFSYVSRPRQVPSMHWSL